MTLSRPNSGELVGGSFPYIERRAGQLPHIERVRQRRFIHHGTSRRIHKNRPRLHFTKYFRVKQMVRLRISGV